MNSGTTLTEEQKLENTKMVLAALTSLAEREYKKSVEPADSTFLHDLIELINRYGLDDTYNIPDHILAGHLMLEIQNLNSTLISMRKWHGWMTLPEKLDYENRVETAVTNQEKATNE